MIKFKTFFNKKLIAVAILFALGYFGISHMKDNDMDSSQAVAILSGQSPAKEDYVHQDDTNGLTFSSNIKNEKSGSDYNEGGSQKMAYKILFRLMGNSYTSTARTEIALASQSCEPRICNKGVCFENLLCHKLPMFEPNYKNPCFYEWVSEDDSDQSVYKNLIFKKTIPNKESRKVQAFHTEWQLKRQGKKTQIRCLPYFFIIGMEKCGTTDLYQRIGMHPQILLTPAKELQWWTRRRFVYDDGNDNFTQKTQTDEFKIDHKDRLLNVPIKHYYAFFDKVAQRLEQDITEQDGLEYHPIITGDGSPNTIYWNDYAEIYGNVTKDGPSVLVAHHIAAILPQSRLICILRNPVDRLYSSYLFFNPGLAVGPKEFHEAVIAGLSLFHKCLYLFSLRYCVYDRILKAQVGSTVNLMQGVYHVMLEDWLSVFNKTRLHVVEFESYKASELDEVNKIFKFLDLRPIDEISPQGVSIMEKEVIFANKKYNKVGDMLPETRKILLKFYAPYNRKLADLLNDDRFLWDK